MRTLTFIGILALSLVAAVPCNAETEKRAATYCKQLKVDGPCHELSIIGKDGDSRALLTNIDKKGRPIGEPYYDDKGKGKKSPKGKRLYYADNGTLYPLDRDFLDKKASEIQLAMDNAEDSDEYTRPLEVAKDSGDIQEVWCFGRWWGWGRRCYSYCRPLIWRSACAYVSPYIGGWASSAYSYARSWGGWGGWGSAYCGVRRVVSMPYWGWGGRGVW